jgi:hypothetical protein
MKRAFGIAACVGFLIVATSAYGDDGNVSQSQLNRLGIGSIDVMSDTEGMQVRGSAFAFTFGFSSASAFMGAPDSDGDVDFDVGPSASASTTQGSTSIGFFSFAGAGGFSRSWAGGF